MAWSVDEVRTYSYTGAAQSETLEPGTYKLECWGARGGRVTGETKGLGGYCAGEIEVSIPTSIGVYVGGKGADVNNSAGGWNGGGYGGGVGGTGYPGGGASDIRVGGSALTDRVIVAGGGGGGGSSTSRYPGDGGGLTGANSSVPGYGGSQSAGGANGGNLGVGGSGAPYVSGGGGGGYYGGGASPTISRGGGGGSSYYGTLANPSTTSGVRDDNGLIKITCLSVDGGGTTKKRRFAQFI